MDTVGAHSDSNSNSKFLPSHDEFEKLYTFAVEFYNLVARYVINSVPAPIPRLAGSGLVSVMKSSLWVFRIQKLTSMSLSERS
jgi:hypothetical protein